VTLKTLPWRLRVFEKFAVVTERTMAAANSFRRVVLLPSFDIEVAPIATVTLKFMATVSSIVGAGVGSVVG
jgi:hypothetical protein